MSKKQIEVKMEIVSDKPIFSYHLLEASKNILRKEKFQTFLIVDSKVTIEGLFITFEYNNEDFYERRIVQRFNKVIYSYDEDYIRYIDDDYIQITDPLFWFKTINSSGMISEYYVVEYENKKYLFLDHLCGNREIFDIKNDTVYKDFLNRRIPCDFKTNIYKKYLKDRDMVNSEWTIKEFKRNKMNYNFTTRIY